MGEQKTGVFNVMPKKLHVVSTPTGSRNFGSKNRESKYLRFIRTDAQSHCLEDSAKCNLPLLGFPFPFW